VITDIDRRIRERQPTTACFANVHVVESARRDARLRQALEAADLVFPDGAPVAWAARHLYHAKCHRIAGADIFAAVNELAASRGYSIFLLGGTQMTLDMLRARLAIESPSLRVAGTASPPFRPSAAQDVAALVADVNGTGADILWVGLGAPKQELWMAANRAALDPPFVAGVGAVFDFASGTKRRAPGLLQELGLEWLYRLAHEPRRLWRRYAFTNASFVIRLAAALTARQKPESIRRIND
jgi:N-acetylglucosaminyldiphosphoundecaprenol N-acetyl-beta-D-mannosaminyltransferase